MQEMRGEAKGTQPGKYILSVLSDTADLVEAVERVCSKNFDGISRESGTGMIRGLRFIESCKYIVEHPNEFAVLDTETTSFKGEVIDLAVIDVAGNIIYDGLLRPACKIEPDAEAIHKISETMVAAAPCFAEEWPEIWGKIGGRGIIAYNAKFDEGRIAHTAIAHNIILKPLVWHCLMQAYAAFYGEPGKSYSRRFQSSRWQKLEDACRQQGILFEQTHRALGDAIATAALIRRIAELGEGAARWKEYELTKFEVAPESWKNWEVIEKSLEL